MEGNVLFTVEGYGMRRRDMEGNVLFTVEGYGMRHTVYWRGYGMKCIVY